MANLVLEGEVRQIVCLSMGFANVLFEGAFYSQISKGF